MKNSVRERGKQQRASLDTQRQTRSDKKIRVNASLDSDTHRKLKRLGIACDQTKTMMAAIIIEIAVNDPDFVNVIQDKFGAKEFRVIPIEIMGRLMY